MRIWLMKITVALLRLTTAVSLRKACDMSRACRPMCESPISPSISALGTSAATESITTRSTAPERSSGDGGDRLRHLGLAQPHHRALSELLLDGPDGRRDGFQLLRHLAHVPSLGSPAGCAPGVRCTAAPRAS